MPTWDSRNRCVCATPLTTARKRTVFRRADTSRGEPAAERRAAVREPHADVVLGDAEDVGDRPLVEPLQVQQDRLPDASGEPGHRAQQGVLLERRAQRGVGIGARVLGLGQVVEAGVRARAASGA